MHSIEIPDPGAENRARMDAIVRSAHAIRLDARGRLDAVASLYEQFGRGEIDAEALALALDALGQGLAQAAKAARKGADDTAKMTRAGAGRAAYLGANHLEGHKDPGAEAVARLFEHMAKT